REFDPSTWGAKQQSSSNGDNGGSGDGGGSSESSEGILLEDFHAYLPSHAYIYSATREPWPAASINGLFPPIPLLGPDGEQIVKKNGEIATVSPSKWLDQNRPLAQMTWVPGRPMLVRDWLLADGGWFKRKAVTCFNLYREPAVKSGNAAKAGLWLEHAKRVFGDDAEHIIKWLAQRVQRPMVKTNHALVLGGEQGIGKDTLLEPVKYAVGSWNFTEISPTHLLGRFNGFAKSVVLRVSEARDLGEIDRFTFYDRTKIYTAAPPDVLRVDEKNLREYAVLNCCGLVITTNHKTDGIYLPSDDRRHFVAWSNCKKTDFPDEYWNRIWTWYRKG